MVLLDDLVRPANKLAIGLLRSPFHRLASGGLMVLSWSGRATGNDFSTPLGYQRDGDQFVVVLSKPQDKQWWKNLRSPWPAEVLVKSERISVVGELVDPADERFYQQVENTLNRLGWMGSQFGGFKYDKGTGLTGEQRDLVAEHAAVVIFQPARAQYEAT